MQDVIRWLILLYSFLLPVQTRYFWVESPIEYQRVSLYGTQILFLIIIITYLFCHSRANGNPEIKNKQKQKDQNVISSGALAESINLTQSVILSEQSESKDPLRDVPRTSVASQPLGYARDDKPFGFLFSFLDSKSKFGMTIIYLCVLFITLQVIVSLRIDLTFQTLLWILQTLLFVWIVKRENLARPVLWAFVGSMAVESPVIWIQMVTQYIPAFKWLGIAEQLSWRGGVSVIDAFGARFLRGYGTFPHPNIAGGYLLIAILAMSEFKVQNSKFRSFNIGLLGLLISGLTLTFSRSALLGFILFVILLLIIHLILKMGNLTSLIVAVLFFLTMIIPMRDLIFSRVNSLNRLETISISERSEYNSYARNIVKSNVWVGVGLGNYTVALQKVHPELAYYQLQPPHSVPLLIMAELGVIGVVILLSITFLFLLTTHSSLLALALLPIFLFDHYLWSLYAGWGVVALAGMLSRFSQQEKK